MEKDRNSQEYEDFVLLTKGGEAELVEKKSRFIATVRPVESEEEAAAFIEEMKKKYYDARHNCSAYVLGSKAQFTRSSDDGEPSGTAGRPRKRHSQCCGSRHAVFWRDAAGNWWSGAGVFGRIERGARKV